MVRSIVYKIAVSCYSFLFLVLYWKHLMDCSQSLSKVFPPWQSVSMKPQTERFNNETASFLAVTL
jgi:hypothetical protein